MSSSPRREVIVPPDWSDAVRSVASSAPPPVTLICGPKNSGKSTFSRLLLNSLLQSHERVGYLDTDVGQPEFGVPGCISLHIVDEYLPDLMNPCIKTPERSCFFGDISPKRDPKAYLSCIFSLYDYFLKEYYQSRQGSPSKSILPLVINTPGWVKGTGYDVLVEILRYITPSEVVQLRISVESKNLPTGVFWSDEHQEPLNLMYISSVQKNSLDQSVLILKDARRMRDSRLFQYFRQCFPTSFNIETNKELAYALASIPPYAVSISKVNVRHLHYKVPRNEIFHSLNATIVGLVVSSSDSGASCRLPWCVGLGIVRGVDIRKDLLYVITPVPCQNLQKVDLLLQGLIEIPTAWLQVRGCVSPYMSTNVLHKLSDKDL